MSSLKNHTKIIVNFLSALFLLLPITSFAYNHIKTIRVQHYSGYSRVILSASKPIAVHGFALNHPGRIVMDIKDVSFDYRVKRHDFDNTPVKDIRTYLHKGHKLRIVFDLNEPVTARFFTKEKPNRLILDLHKSNKKKVVAFKWPFHLPKKPQVFYSAYRPTPAQTIVAQANKAVRKIIIVVDPGHGGKDPGATGPLGTHEKNVVLKISRYIKADLNHRDGFEAKLTRHGDYYLTLRDRLAIARKDKADMFIAIHADAFPERDAYGASVFALSTRGATSEAARWLARRENASELMGGVNLSNKTNLLKSVLINLSQTATIRSSIAIGKRIIGSLGNVERLHHGHVEQAAFVVLKSPDIPSLLVETGFITNPKEERRLDSAWYQQKLASAITQGIVSYFVKRPPPGTLLSAERYHDRITVQTYRVKSGDSLTGLAERFNTTVSSLKKKNHLRRNGLFIGQILKI